MAELNPYAPPVSDPGKPALNDPFIPAGAWLRFANLLIDYIGQLLLAVLIGFVLGILGKEALFDEIPDFLFGIALMLVYYTTLEGCFGLTLGKVINRQSVRAKASPTPARLPSAFTTFVRVICDLTRRSRRLAR